jgi:predicted ArsR family transcriptional regulator
MLRSMPEDNLIRDPKALRALSHPLRWKLINLLTSDGQATATRCAEMTGESVASCSYHLKMLAKYGFIEEAPTGHGREKPWRLTDLEQSFTNRGLDEEGVSAAQAAVEAMLDNELAETKARFRQRAQHPENWDELLGVNAVTTVLTLEEMTELITVVRARLNEHATRIDHPDEQPEDGEKVRLFFVSSRIRRD